MVVVVVDKITWYVYLAAVWSCLTGVEGVVEVVVVVTVVVDKIVESVGEVGNIVGGCMPEKDHPNNIGVSERKI